MIVIDFLFQAVFLLLAASIVILAGWLVLRLVTFVIGLFLMALDDEDMP